MGDIKKAQKKWKVRPGDFNENVNDNRSYHLECYDFLE